MRALAIVIAALAVPSAVPAHDLWSVSATLERPLGTPEADALVAEAGLTFVVAR